MFDIIGFGASIHKNDATRTINYVDDRDSKTKNINISTSVSSEYILPGVHYISKGGLTVGVRNILQMSAYTSDDVSPLEVMPHLEFVTGAYVGFTFGK